MISVKFVNLVLKTMTFKTTHHTSVVRKKTFNTVKNTKDKVTYFQLIEWNFNFKIRVIIKIKIGLLKMILACYQDILFIFNRTVAYLITNQR